MMDKSLPYHEVFMIREDLVGIPFHTLAEGFCFSMYKEGHEAMWAELETAVGEFTSPEKALEYFRRTFLGNGTKARDRCIFVLDSQEDIAGTLSIWHPEHFPGETDLRLHWLAVHPRYQGKGIAKALMTRGMELAKGLGLGERIYLSTQTWSFKAISIYLSFGFKPHPADMPEAWEMIHREIGKSGRRSII
ncbi:MAG: GNAT family N-acetyltransferase [Clostridia bacterium]